MKHHNTSKNKIVSVIIPTYNRGNFITRSLLSVLNQSFTNFEVIIVDDASTDDTEKIISSINDSRIRYVRNENRVGAAISRNVGIQMSSANYIAFQDSDDEWLLQKLEKQMAIFNKQGEDVGAVFTSFIRVKDNQTTYYPQTNDCTSGNISRPLLNGNFITTQAAVVRRECFEKVGLFDETLPRLQDWELFIRLSKAYRIIHLDEPLLVAFHSNTSITSANSLFPFALEYILTKHKDFFSQDVRSYSRNYYRLGKSYCEINEFEKAIDHFKYSLKLHPFQLSCAVLALSVISGKIPYKITSGIFKKINQHF